MVFVSMWTSIAAWFTPSVLFCVTNLIIATIFITASNNKHHNRGDSHSFTRSVSSFSFLDRARSMNLRSAAAYGSSSRLAQSIHSSSSFVTPPPESSIQSESERDSSLFERVKSIKFSSFYTENSTFQTEVIVSNSPGQLGRSPSFLDRLKSFKIYKPVVSSSTQPEDSSRNDDVTLSKYKKPVVEMKRSRSGSDMKMAAEDEETRRRPATTREMVKWNVDDEEVDAKADDFISRFKQQLKLQRLESLVRYNNRLNGRA